MHLYRLKALKINRDLDLKVRIGLKNKIFNFPVAGMLNFMSGGYTECPKIYRKSVLHLLNFGTLSMSHSSSMYINHGTYTRWLLKTHCAYERINRSFSDINFKFANAAVHIY